MKSLARISDAGLGDQVLFFLRGGGGGLKVWVQGLGFTGLGFRGLGV